MTAAYSVNLAFGSLAIFFSVALLISLPHHLRVRNTGTLIMIGWGFVGVLTQGINAFLFVENTSASKATLAYCDFAAAIGYVYPFGFSAGSLALLRRLELIASTRQVTQSQSQARRSFIIDLVVGVVCPLLLIPLHLCVQGHRLDIVKNFGCIAPLYLSAPTLVIFCMWQVVINSISLVYAVMVIRWFTLRRRQFAAILHSSGSGMSQRRYIRLTALASLEIIFTLPSSLYVFVSNATQNLQPWTGWNDVHYGFSAVTIFDMDEISAQFAIPMQIGRWIGVVAVFIFLSFFGPSKESLDEIRLLYTKISSRFKRGSRRGQSASFVTDADDLSIDRSIYPGKDEKPSPVCFDGKWASEKEIHMRPMQVSSPSYGQANRYNGVHVFVERVEAA